MQHETERRRRTGHPLHGIPGGAVRRRRVIGRGTRRTPRRFDELSAEAFAGAVRRGIVATTPGPKGGYRLAKAPKDISLLDIVLAVEGPAPAFRCAEIRQRGPNPLPQRYFTKPCQINAAMLKAEKAYRAELAKVSVADLLADLGADDDGGIAARGCAFLELHERKTGNRASS